MLGWSENDWPEVLWNFMKYLREWNLLGKLLRRGGVEPQVSAMFYRAVVQVVLLLGAETWVLLEVLYHKLGGAHKGFLNRITVQRVVRHKDRTFWSVAVEKVLNKSGTQSLRAYIDRW